MANEMILPEPKPRSPVTVFNLFGAAGKRVQTGRCYRVTTGYAFVRVGTLKLKFHRDTGLVVGFDWSLFHSRILRTLSTALDNTTHRSKQ